MKRNIIATIFVAYLGINQLCAQTQLVDTLNIILEDEVTVQVISNNIHAQRQKLNWKHLIEDFQHEMKNNRSEIPAYEFYKIDFVKNVKMTVEEKIKEKEVIEYRIKRDEITLRNKTSKAKLHAENTKLEINIYFENISELIEKDYVTVVAEALNKMETRPDFAKSIFNSSDQYEYLYDCQFMVKKEIENEQPEELFKPHPVLMAKGFIGRANTNLGNSVFNTNNLGVEYGVGVSFGDRKKHAFLITGRHQWVYFGGELSRNMPDFYIGGMYKPNRWFSLGIAKSPSKLSYVTSLATRYALSVYPIKNGSITFTYLNHSVLRSTRGCTVEIGFGF